MNRREAIPHKQGGELASGVPSGYALIPLRNGSPEVTNEMKVECIGEFSWQEEAPYYDEDGELHDYVATHTVPWSVCKAIYKKMASVAHRKQQEDQP